MTLLARLVDVSQRVAATSGRLAKVRELAEVLRALAPEEVETAVAYLSGDVPQGRIGLGYAQLRDATAAASPAAEPSLGIGEVDQRLAALAQIRGAGSASRRADALNELFARATSSERDFLLHLLAGELRQGALAGVMLEAIAAAAAIPAPSVRRAAMYAANLGAVARAALAEGEPALARFQLEPMSPVAPMLAQTAADVADALARLGGPLAFEWKMDGARIQLHKRGERDPRVLAQPERGHPRRARGDRARARPARPRPDPRRGGACLHRRRPAAARSRSRCAASAASRTSSARARSFRCAPTSSTACGWRARAWPTVPTRERFAALERALPESLRMPRLVTDSADAARAFYESALAAGHEGVMAKSLDAPYEAGNRGAGWLKIKRAHTLDLVVLAAEWGHGRRTGVLSNLHLGALDPATGEYVMLGKTFKGLTDAMLESQTRELLAREVRRDRTTVYVRPELVVEVAFSDLQASPRYPGGLALRLARVKRYRDDKRADDADTMESVRRIFAAQG